MESAGLLLKVEPITDEVGHSERTGFMLEPMIKKQRFVKKRPLAGHVLETQKKSEEKVNIIPEWCISRQLWWEHQIPAWYKNDEIYVSMEAPKEEGWVQDEDVLGTWFSSALWPFATLGWPNKTKLLEKYYPNQCLVTGYDIIPFWVNRMTFQGEKMMGARPFEDCLIHGLIRDKQGRKFSKSLGNGIDPFDMVELYGADALRYYLATDVAPGTDMRFDEEKIKSTWNFINKIWNAARFVLAGLKDIKEIKLENLKKEDQWILTKLESTIRETKKFMDKYEFNNAGASIYEFTWNYFCDYYIEMSKYSLDSESTKSTLCFVLTTILKLLQPFMPYVTDEIYSRLPVKESEHIMMTEYPKYDTSFTFDSVEKEVDDWIAFIKNFRNTKAENNITKELKVYFPNGENELISKILKIEDNLVYEPQNSKEYKILSNTIKASIYFEKTETEEDKKTREKKLVIYKTLLQEERIYWLMKIMSRKHQQILSKWIELN